MSKDVQSLGTNELDGQAREVESMQVLFALAQDLMCVAGSDGYLKVVNPAFTNVLGHSREELLARPFKDFLRPDDVARTLAEVTRLEQGAMVIDFENRYLCANEKYVWLQWSSVASAVAASAAVEVASG